MSPHCRTFISILSLCVILLGCTEESAPHVSQSNEVADEPSVIAKAEDQEEMEIDQMSESNEAVKMSSQLSSRAKKEILLTPPENMVSVLLTVSGSTGQPQLTHDVEESGGKVLSWSDTTNLVNVIIPAGKIESLAKLNGVTYVEVGGKYGEN